MVCARQAADTVLNGYLAMGRGLFATDHSFPLAVRDDRLLHCLLLYCAHSVLLALLRYSLVFFVPLVAVPEAVECSP